MTAVYEHKVRVRYAECDKMGFVHHSAYALYFEEARTEMMRSFGIPYSDLEAEGYIMPVKQMEFSFFKAGKYDDLLTVKVRLEEMPAVRSRFTYETYNQQGDLLNVGKTELFFAKKETLRPTALPKKWLEKIENIFKP